MRFRLRNLSATVGVVGITLGIAWADPPAATKDAASAERKTDHPSVAALRAKIMAEYHGQATGLFTTMPGFGMERMMPIYQRIPWEVPHFSTNDVEVENAPAIPAVLKDVFARSIESFEKSTGAKTQSPPVAVAPNVQPPKTEPGFGPTMNGTIVGGMQLRLLDLIGNLDPARPKVYSGGKAFVVIRSRRIGGPIGNFEVGNPQIAQQAEQKRTKDAKNHAGDMEERPLDLFESAGLVELSDGKETFVRQKEKVTRMMGALRASNQCLKCHTENRKGDLLGALSYTFLDTKGMENRGNGPQQP